MNKLSEFELEDEGIDAFIDAGPDAESFYVGPFKTYVETMNVAVGENESVSSVGTSEEFEYGKYHTVVWDGKKLKML